MLGHWRASFHILQTYIETWFQYHSHPPGHFSHSIGVNVVRFIYHVIDYWHRVSNAYSPEFLYKLEWPNYTLYFTPKIKYPHVNKDHVQQLYFSFGGSVVLMSSAEIPNPDALKNIRGAVFLSSCALHPDIMASLSHVTSLAFEHCCDRSDDCDTSQTMEAFSNMSQLKRLSVQRCDDVLESSLVNVSQNFKGLVDLHLEDMDVPELDTNDVFCNLSHLTALRCRNVNFGDCLTDTEFSYLSNLRILELEDCTLRHVTNNGFRHLSQLTSISVIDDCHISITENAFQNMPHLRSLKTLKYQGVTFTDCTLECYPSLRYWNMSLSYQTKLSDTAFRHLSQLTVLGMAGCRQESITDAVFLQFTNLRVLDMSHCQQTTITDCAFQHLSQLRALRMEGCDQSTITDHAFQHLSYVDDLCMDKCTQFSDDAFQHLSRLTHLSMNECDQETLSDVAFTYMPNLRVLKMNFCDQSSLTEAALAPLKHLVSVEKEYCQPEDYTAVFPTTIRLGYDDED